MSTTERATWPEATRAYVEKLEAELQRVKEERDEAREWRRQFDCCMCGALMDAHGPAENHAPVSMYDYHPDQSEARAQAAESELQRVKEEVREIANTREKYWARLQKAEAALREAVGVLTAVKEGMEAPPTVDAEAYKRVRSFLSRFQGGTRSTP